MLIYNLKGKFLFILKKINLFVI